MSESQINSQELVYKQVMSIPVKYGYHHVLLLLDYTTLLRGRCGGHHSAPASSGMHFIVYFPDIPHVSVDTVHPSALWSPSSSSPRWYRLRCLSSDNFLVSSLHVSKPPQSHFSALLCDVLFIQILPDVTISLVVSWCLAYIHIVISVPSIFIILEQAIRTVCNMYSIAG